MHLRSISILLLIFFASGLLNHGSAQCMMYEVSVVDRLNEAELVVEGKVLASHAYWDKDQNNIYTLHQFKVDATVKGSSPSDQLNVITRGGTVGNEMQIDNPSLELNVGDVGMLFLKKKNIILRSQTSSKSEFFEAVTSSQGFVKYDLSNGSARDPFNHYDDIHQDLYAKLKNSAIHFSGAYKGGNSTIEQRSPNAVSISSFSPSTITAGTQSQLTINGSGFGSSQGNGQVEFYNSNNGVAYQIVPLASQYVSWSNTQIVVEVPYRAGSGIIQVRNDANETGESSTSLDIVYNIINVESSGIFYRINVVDRDDSGGYEYQFNEDFNTNTAAKEAFMRAYNNWRCSNVDGTGIYWVEGAGTTVSTPLNDNVNLIAFDDDDPLPTGVLGRTTNRYQGCVVGGTDTYWFAEETDLIFQSEANLPSWVDWNFDEQDGTTGGSEVDFESVALHELGHCHQLSHVLDNNSVMHYFINAGVEQRVIDGESFDGGADVLSYSSGVCGYDMMMADFVCELLPLNILSFEGHAEETQNILYAHLVADVDIDEVILEKSPSPDFSMIDLLTSNERKLNDGEYAFHFVDRFPSVDAYYRLHIVDGNGHKIYSRIIYIQNKASESAGLKLYPVPAGDRLWLSGQAGKNVQLSIVGLGQKHHVTCFDDEYSGSKEIDIAFLSDGYYYLKVQSQKGIEIIPFVKQ